MVNTHQAPTDPQFKKQLIAQDNKDLTVAAASKGNISYSRGELWQKKPPKTPVKGKEVTSKSSKISPIHRKGNS